MTKEELDKILSEHKKWINNDGGSRANLSGDNLFGAEIEFMRDSDLILAICRENGWKVKGHIEDGEK